MPLSRKGKFKLASVAPEKVFAVIPWNWPKRRPNFVRNPATGTLEVAPYARLKARKALVRKVRRMKMRLYLRYAELQVSKFLLSCRCARLNVVGYLERRLHQVFSHRHGLVPPSH